MEGNWIGWAYQVQIDIDSLRTYAHASYAAVDARLASLSDIELAAPVEMSPVGLGQQTLGSFLMNLLVFNAAAHTGESSVVKGLQGLRGYPF